MKAFVCIIACSLLIVSCGKDKFKTEPQIKFKSITPDVFLSEGTTIAQSPILKINVTDLEGNLGMGNDDTASFIYIKNITIPNSLVDSFPFPDLSSARRQNLDVDVDVVLWDALGRTLQPNRPYTDTLYFEVYVTDNAKNKSNVITTSDPLYYVTP